MANGNVKTENGKPRTSKSREKVYFHYAKREQVQAHECG